MYIPLALIALFLQHDTPQRVEELFEDIKDGVKLLCLLEVLSGETLVSYHLLSVISLLSIRTVRGLTNPNSYIFYYIQLTWLTLIWQSENLNIDKIY